MNDEDNDYMTIIRDIEKDGILVDFDDGHIPELKRCLLEDEKEKEFKNDDEKNYCSFESNAPATSSNTAATHTKHRTRLLKYKTRNKASIAATKEYDDDNHPCVAIYENALPPHLCHEIYNFTAKRDVPWGTYVTKTEALEPQNGSHNKHESSLSTKEMIQYLATEAVRNFLFSPLVRQKGDEKNSLVQVMVSGCASTSSGGSNSSRSSSSDASCSFPPPTSLSSYGSDPISAMSNDDRIHGVQVWALPAVQGSSVPYHLDYAEYIRYVHDIIVPPLYAGTVQCTPHAIQGGTFAVHMGGLDHYQTHGYKGCLSSVESEGGGNVNFNMGGWDENILNHVQQVTVEEDVHHGSNHAGWVSIPYKFNQGILHSGTLPHLSGTVVNVNDDTCTENGAKKRVILGFNVFGHGAGEWVKKCPEHSDHFRNMVRMHRWSMYHNLLPSLNYSPGEMITRHGTRSDEDKKRFSLEAIQKNRGFAKLLVLAKREEIKQQWKEMQGYMTKWILQRLNEGEKRNEEKSHEGKYQNMMTVSELLYRWEEEHGPQVGGEGIGKSVDMGNSHYNRGILHVSKNDLHVHMNDLVRCGTIQCCKRRNNCDYENCSDAGGGGDIEEFVDLESLLFL